MATLLSQAIDSWSFDKLIQPLSNPDKLEELLKYLNGKHATHQHDHIDPVALSRVLIAIKFVSSKKKLFNTLKPSIDQLINLCDSIISALEHDNKLTKSTPWLWLKTILAFYTKDNNNNNHHKYPYFNVENVSRKLNEQLKFDNDINNSNINDKLPQFLFPEWSFTTKSGMKIFEQHFKSKMFINMNNNDNSEMSQDSDESDDDDLFGDNEFKIKKTKKPKKDENKNNKKDIDDILSPKSRTLSNVKFLSFPRPNPPQNSTSNSNPASLMQEAMKMRKRQKTGALSYNSIGGITEQDRKRKLSAINDKLNRMMNKKNEKKNSIRLLSITEKRQMKEISERKEQERKYALEQTRLEKQRLKKLEKEKLEREEKEKQLLSLNNMPKDEDLDALDDFDAFMNDLDGDDNTNKDSNNANNNDDKNKNGPKPLMMDLDNFDGPPLENNNDTNNDNNNPSIPALTTAPALDIDSNDEHNIDNKKGISFGGSSSDDESLADMLVAPGEEDNVKKQQEEKKKDNRDPLEVKLISMGIPKQLHKMTWLYENCNALTQENREKIVKFLTGKYSKDGVEKEEIVLHKNVISDTETTESVFRMMFKDKKWKKVIYKKRTKKK